jgi:hypothetical protein
MVRDSTRSSAFDEAKGALRDGLAPNPDHVGLHSYALQLLLIEQDTVA